MVKIIKGSYGRKVGSVIKPVNPGEIIELEPEKEQRLVSIGVAEYVGAEAVKAEELPAKADAEEAEEADSEVVDELPEYSIDMKLDQLKAIAEQYGVDASGLRSKKEVVEAIDAAREELPDLDVSDVVE